MELYSVPYRLRDYSWRDRNSYTNRVSRKLTNAGVLAYERGLYEGRATLTLYYDTQGGNIFTASHLRKIQEIENDLLSSSGYTSHCMTHNASLACKPFKSIIRYFDGTFKSVDSVFDDHTFSNIAGVLYAANNNNATKRDFQFFLPNSISITPTSVSGSMTRSEMLIGCSLSGASKCRSDEWRQTTQTFLMDNVKPKITKYVDIPDFDFYYFSSYMWLKDVLQQAIKDMLCAVGSMLFIFLIIVMHTHSLFITCLAVFSILASFIGTELFYAGVIGFQYFGFFHVLSIFIILGIGADNIFVFYDTWRLTAFSTYPSIAHRLSDAYSRSALSMFITSLTTCVAFFSSAISPLLATRSFGVFSGMLIMYNYMSVIVYFPTVVVMYHLYFENWYYPCCRPCIKDEEARHNRKGNEKNTLNEQHGEYNHSYDAPKIKPQQEPCHKYAHDKPDKGAYLIPNGTHMNGNLPGKHVSEKVSNGRYSKGIAKSDKYSNSVPSYMYSGLYGQTTSHKGDYYGSEPSYVYPLSSNQNGNVPRGRHASGFDMSQNGSSSNGLLPRLSIRRIPDLYNGERLQVTAIKGTMPKVNNTSNGIFLNTKSLQNGAKPLGHTNGFIGGHQTQENDKSNSTEKKHARHQKKMVIFFRDYYFRFVTHKVIRWILLPIFAAIVAVLAYQASKLEADSEQVH